MARQRITPAQRAFLARVRRGEIWRVGNRFATYGGASGCTTMAARMQAAGLASPPTKGTAQWTLTQAGEEALDA